MEGMGRGRHAVGRGRRAGMEEVAAPRWGCGGGGRAGVGEAALGWGRLPHWGGGGRRAGVAAVGVAAVPGSPGWGWPPCRGRRDGGDRRAGVGKQVAGRPVLGAVACGSGGRWSPPPPGAPSSGATRRSGGMREVAAARNRLNPPASSRGEDDRMREMGEGGMREMGLRL
jgi:hypothetical protein